MSYTGIYSPLHPLDVPATDLQREPGAVTPAVKIHDPDGLREHVPDCNTDMHTKTLTDDSEYPGRTWEYLEGFQTWEFDHFNIERLAIPGDDAIDFWTGVSEYTEPFQFVATTGGWPHALDIATSPRPVDVGYHVVCHSGDLWTRELRAERCQPEVSE